MAKSHNLREMQDEYKESIVGLCLVCEKACQGWYARYDKAGVCSKKCMLEQDKKPKYPGYTEEEFLARQGETFCDSSFQLDGGDDGSPDG